jgi:hypothetical protein
VDCEGRRAILGLIHWLVWFTTAGRRGGRRGTEEEEVGCEGQGRILKEGRKRFFIFFLSLGLG